MQKRISLKSILYGFIVDSIGTLLIGICLSIIWAIVTGSIPTNFQGSYLIVMSFFGFAMDILGGYIAAKTARFNPRMHAFGVWTLILILRLLTAIPVYLGLDQNALFYKFDLVVDTSVAFSLIFVLLGAEIARRTLAEKVLVPNFILRLVNKIKSLTPKGLPPLLKWLLVLIILFVLFILPGLLYKNKFNPTSILKDAIYGTHNSEDTQAVQITKEILDEELRLTKSKYPATFKIDEIGVIGYDIWISKENLGSSVSLLNDSIGELNKSKLLEDEIAKGILEKIENISVPSEEFRAGMLASYKKNLDDTTRQELKQKRYASLLSYYKEILVLNKFLLESFGRFGVTMDNGAVAANFLFPLDQDYYNNQIDVVEEKRMGFVLDNEKYLTYINLQLKKAGINLGSEDIIETLKNRDLE